MFNIKIKELLNDMGAFNSYKSILDIENTILALFDAR